MTDQPDAQQPDEEPGVDEAAELAGAHAVTSRPEDDDPLQHVGEPADPPEDSGLPEDADDDEGRPSAAAPPELPEARPWRLAGCLIQQRAEQNALWPGRDIASDGTIGDAAHAGRDSDHNPWVVDSRGMGVVRATDTDVDRFPAAAYAEHVRKLGAGGDPRLNPGGYVIYNSRIASADHGWGWRYYTGVNKHTHHVHVSVTTRQAGYDLRTSWRLAELLAPVHRHATPTISRHRANPPAAVRDAQGHMNAWRRRRRLSTHPLDGVWDEWLEIASRTFQRTYGLKPDGIWGDDTWRVVHTITKGASA